MTVEWAPGQAIVGRTKRTETWNTQYGNENLEAS